MEPMTTLEVFCNAMGWQGGTIHQAKQRFAVESLKNMDKVCTALSSNISNISDPRTALYFMEKRREAHRLHIIGLTA